MTEREKLIEIIYKQSGVYRTTAEKLADKILSAGYRLPAGKAPLLTDEQLESVYVPKMVRSVAWEDLVEYAGGIAKAQNDADHKFYTGGKE